MQIIQNHIKAIQKIKYITLELEEIHIHDEEKQEQTNNIFIHNRKPMFIYGSLNAFSRA